MTKTLRHYEESAPISASPEELFAYVDDHKRFSSHMSQPSWMMGGGHMDVSVDVGNGQKVGSHIRLSGTAFGIKLYLDEVVTRHDPPFMKIWEIVGTPKLFVVGYYRMGIEIKPQDNSSRLCVYIDYELPTHNVWLGQLFSGVYARWCVRQIIKGASDYFARSSHTKISKESVMHMGVKDVVKSIGKNLNEAKDLVCSMQIDLGSTKFKSTYQGKIYGFCSAECKATFDENPFQYANANC